MIWFHLGSSFSDSPWLSLFARFDGQLILPYMTPAELGMEDEDIIDVYVSRPSETGKRPLDDGEDQEADRKRGMWFF